VTPEGQPRDPNLLTAQYLENSAILQQSLYYYLVSCEAYEKLIGTKMKETLLCFILVSGYVC